MPVKKKYLMQKVERPEATLSVPMPGHCTVRQQIQVILVCHMIKKRTQRWEQYLSSGCYWCNRRIKGHSFHTICLKKFCSRPTVNKQALDKYNFSWSITNPRATSHTNSSPPPSHFRTPQSKEITWKRSGANGWETIQVKISKMCLNTHKKTVVFPELWSVHIWKRGRGGNKGR